MVKKPRKIYLPTHRPYVPRPHINDIIEQSLTEIKNKRQKIIDDILVEVINLYLKTSYTKEQIKKLKIKPKDPNVIKVIHSFNDIYTTLKGIPYKQISYAYDGSFVISSLEGHKIIKEKLNEKLRTKH